MKLYGLIGYPLTHSFSKKFFSQKFEKENIKDSRYELFEIRDSKELLEIVKHNPDLKGLNVTIPHKQAVIPFLHELDEAAKKIGAVNVIKVENGKLKGYNSDYFGFKQSLEKFLDGNTKLKALVLGTGGAAKAVMVALQDMQIPYKTVSRTAGKSDLVYEDLKEDLIFNYRLIINTSPVGMYPNVQDAPAIPYFALTSSHYLFDLVYNPEETAFMNRGAYMKAKTMNGLEMLHLQAEKAWEIWNS